MSSKITGIGFNCEIWNFILKTFYNLSGNVSTKKKYTTAFEMKDTEH